MTLDVEGLATDYLQESNAVLFSGEMRLET